MELVLPGMGLTIWMSLVFIILMLLLKKFAWKPILKSLHEREHSIEEALKSAEIAKEQMAKLKSENDALLKQAREERDVILKEAKEMKDAIIHEAKKSAEEEGKKMIQRASDEIAKQKSDAINELKSQVATLSVSIAEKLIDNQLSNNSDQQAIIANHINNLNQNQKAIA